MLVLLVHLGVFFRDGGQRADETSRARPSFSQAQALILRKHGIGRMESLIPRLVMTMGQRGQHAFEAMSSGFCPVFSIQQLRKHGLEAGRHCIVWLGLLEFLTH
jgi:hypothetical protein